MDHEDEGMELEEVRILNVFIDRLISLITKLQSWEYVKQSTYPTTMYIIHTHQQATDRKTKGSPT